MNFESRNMNMYFSKVVFTLIYKTSIFCFVFIYGNREVTQEETAARKVNREFMSGFPL